MIYLLPALAACLYALGAMGLKKSMQSGTAPRRVMAISNVAMALWSIPVFFFADGQWDFGAWLAAIGAGAALFIGRIFAVKAIEHGDISVVTPLLGMKTVMVALLSKIFFPFEFNNILLLCAVMASAGVALLQRGPIERRAGTRKAGLYAGGASLLFAITDISVQGAREALGVGVMVPTLFLTVGLMVPLLGKHASPAAGGRKPLYAGSAVIGFQTTLVIFVIATFGQAALVNVIYSSRALWSVMVDVVMGEPHVRDYLVSRLAGATLICGAVILAIVSKMI